MKKAIGWVLMGAAMILFGSACGGGGGTGGTDGNNDGGTSGLTNVQLIGTLTNSSAGVSLQNLVVGDTVQLKFVGTDDTGHQVVRAGSNWSTTASGAVATVDASGVLHAVGVGSGTVTGTGPNGVQSANITITNTQTLVSGRVRNINNTGVAAVRVLFYNASGSQVGSAVTGADGTFRANVPATAKGFSVDIESADPPTSSSIYYRQFYYNNKSYLNGADCAASLPTLNEGQVNALPSDIVLADRASGPPPPPTGCLNG